MDILPKIKVLLVLPFFYPHRGGSQKYAEELYVEVVKKHPNVHVDVLCYNTDKSAIYEEYRGLNIHRIPCFTLIPARFALPDPFFLALKLLALSKNKYDFVNTHIRFFDPTWWLWIYAKIIGAKSIFTGHVATHPVHQSKVVEAVGKIVDLTIASFSLKRYNFLTFTNRKALEFFKKTFNINLNKSTIVYGGVDTDFFTPGTKDKTREIPKIDFHIESEKIVVTFVGRLIWTKGITYLYEAAKYVVSKHKNTIFVLAGPGELESELAAKIKEDKLEGKVILTGNLAYGEVQKLLAISNIFVNPSHHNEGFPNTILEAGSSECYVIATDNAGTSEVVIPGKTGTLIPQKDTQALIDALEWAITKTDERESIAKEFRKELITKFDWKIIAEQYFQLLVRWQK